MRELRARAQRRRRAGALDKAGVLFAFASAGLREPRDFVRNAARAVKDGLSPDAAVRALTINAATIAGAGDRLGSLEKGKIANVIVTEGDLFDEKTRIVHVFVDGRARGWEGGGGKWSESRRGGGGGAGGGDGAGGGGGGGEGSLFFDWAGACWGRSRRAQIPGAAPRGAGRSAVRRSALTAFVQNPTTISAIGLIVFAIFAWSVWSCVRWLMEESCSSSGCPSFPSSLSFSNSSARSPPSGSNM